MEVRNGLEKLSGLPDNERMDPHPAYQELASAMATRLEIIQDREWFARDAAGHLAALQQVSEKLDLAAARLPRPLPGELAHFLDRRSYDKALAWIRNQS